MTKIHPILFLIILLGTGILTSCTSSKKMIYLQGADKIKVQTIGFDYALRVQPQDILSVTLSCADEELLKPFANSELLGSSSTSSQTSQGLLVGRDGYINIPVLGRLKVVGMTSDEIEQAVSDRLVQDDYMNNPQVNVRFLNARVMVMGEVKNPGAVEMASERLTILEALTQAGDLQPSARRENILVIREQDGKRTTYTLDLTKADSLFASPVYYLQQNDIVYVEPNKSIQVKGSSALTFLGAGGSIISVLASIVSLVLVLTN